MVNVNWKVVKIIFLLLIAILAFIIPPKKYDNVPPLFVYPGITISAIIFGMIFLKGVASTRKLSPGNLNGNPLHFMSDPLPACHFVMLAGIFNFVGSLLHLFVFGNKISPETFIELSFSIGLFVCLFIANKKFT